MLAQLQPHLAAMNSIFITQGPQAVRKARGWPRMGPRGAVAGRPAYLLRAHRRQHEEVFHEVFPRVTSAVEGVAARIETVRR